jgi:hypothetical protein
MGNVVDPDELLNLTFDDLVDIFIVVEYLKIAKDSSILDIDFCIGKLNKVTDSIKLQYCGVDAIEIQTKK